MKTFNATLLLKKANNLTICIYSDYSAYVANAIKIEQLHFNKQTIYECNRKLNIYLLLVLKYFM